MERSAALAAYNAQLIAPLTAVIEQQAETIERQAEQLVGKEQEIGAIREERGRLGAELDRATSAVVALNDQLAAAELSRRRDTRRLSIALAVAGALAVAAGTAPAWVR